MLVSLNWLNDYVEVKDIPTDVLRRKMSAAGLSVERQQVVGEKLESIVIGEIVEKVKHPESDHLWITKVNISRDADVRTQNSDRRSHNIVGQGVGSENLDQRSEISDQRLVLQIVTGAQNIEVGQKVPVVENGSSLPDGTEIITTKLRGVESQGMMCSEKELGLGEDHGGILILDKDAPVGVSFSSYYNFPDLVFDIEITPNRGDLNSMLGIAREVAVLVDRPLKMPEMKKLGAQIEGSRLRVQIQDRADCIRFSAVEIEGDFGLDTPFLIKQRLLRSGMRPISLLVDISNYVMLELGQPNHAYAAEMVANSSLCVRRAHYGEKLTLLDGKTVELDMHNLVVADDQKILGLAGIMGGEEGKFEAANQRVIVEAAHFDGVVIRKTTMSKNIRSEASMRFERKVDSELTVQALGRFCTILGEVARFEQSSNLVDENLVSNAEVVVTLRSSLLQTYLGKDLTLGYVERILESLGFEVVEGTHSGEHGGWRISVRVPSWRIADVSIEEDLIEEVARIYGFDNIPVSTPKGLIPVVKPHRFANLKESLVKSLVARGWWELLTYSFTDQHAILATGKQVEQAVKVHNPLSVDHLYMRLSLLPNLIRAVGKNLNKYPILQVFEQGRVYHQGLYEMLPASLVNEELERENLALIAAGREYVFEEAYKIVLGELEAIFKLRGMHQVRLVQGEEVISIFGYSMYHPGRVGGCFLGDVCIGLYGELHPQLVKEFGLDQPILVSEIDLTYLLNSADYRLYEQFSIYPSSGESVSFVLRKQVQIGPIAQAVRDCDGRIVEVVVRDVYEGDGVPEGKKSVTLDLRFQQMEGPITDLLAGEIRKRVTDTLITGYQAELRNN